MTLLGRLRRVVKAHTAPRRPPIADPGIFPDYAGEIAIEVTYAPDGSRRSVITQDAVGGYRVRVEWWNTAGWETGVPAAWARGDSHAVLADTLAQARVLAAERVR